MSDDNTTETATETVDTPTVTPIVDTPVEAETATTDWKAHARKWETKAKDNYKVLHERTAAYEAEIEAKTSEYDALRLAHTRFRVGVAAGLPPVLADRVVGDDEEAMMSDAQRLLAEIGRAPVNLSQLSSSEPDAGMDYAAIARSMF